MYKSRTTRLTSASLKELAREDDDIDYDDNESVNLSLTSYKSDHTHAILFERTFHGMLRSEERNITDRTYQKALKYGFRYKNGLQEGGEKVIYILYREANEPLTVFVLVPKDRRITNMITCYRVEEEKFKGTGYSKIVEDENIGKETKPDELKSLIDSGLDPLIIMRKCCFVNNLECAKHLIENRIVNINDICEKSHNYSWLHYSTHYNSSEIVQYVIENGIDINIRESRNENTAQDSLIRNIISSILNFCTNQGFLKQVLQEHNIELKYGESLPIVESEFIEKNILSKANGLKIKPLIRIYYMLSVLKMIEKPNQDTRKCTTKIIFEMLALILAIALVVYTFTNKFHFKK